MGADFYVIDNCVLNLNKVSAFFVGDRNLELQDSDESKYCVYVHLDDGAYFSLYKGQRSRCEEVLREIYMGIKNDSETKTQ